MRRKTVSLAAVVGMVVLWAGPSHAQVLIDDFNDGNHDGWTDVGNLSLGGGPPIFEVVGADVNGEFNLRSTGPVPPDLAGNWLGSYWANTVHSNGYLRAKIRNNVDHTDVVLGMRGDVGTDGTYYFVASSAVTPARARLLKKTPHGDFTYFETPDVRFPFDNGMDWNIEAGVVGNRVSMKVWQVGDPEPAAPQLVATDPTPVPVSTIGVLTWNVIHNTDWNPLNAVFDDIYFRSAADFDGDGDCDIDDLNALLQEGPVATPVSVTPGVNGLYDLTGDDLLSNEDVDFWLADAATSQGFASPFLRGDANLDGVVDVSDFNNWNSAKFTATMLWENGDFDGDGVADVSDFNVWNTNKFESSGGTSAVPEPAATTLVVVGACLLPIVAGTRKFRRGEDS